MKTILAYQPAIARRIDRYQRFFDSDRPGDLLVAIRPRWVHKKNLFDYDFEHGGHLEMAADMQVSARALLAENGGSDDDLIPWLSADFGIAIHHAFLVDLPVRFAEWTSWGPHPLSGEDGYGKLDQLRFDPANRWVRLVREMIAWWIEHHDGICMPGSFLHYSPLDLANALRGNAIFTDIYDRPEDVAALLDRCTEAIIAMEEEMRTVCREQIEEVGMPFWGAMAPPGALYMSEDAMDLGGPKVARKWSLPWSTRVRDHFGCVAVHHHMLGRLVQPVIGQYVQRSVIQIANDPNCPPAFDHLAALARDSAGNALMCDCTPEQILANLDQLRGIRAILVTGAIDPAMAAEVVAAVRSISNIT